MKKFLTFAFAIALASQSLIAAPERVMTVSTGVDGMVCSFCAQGLRVHFSKHDAVSNIHIDLTRKLLILEERKGASISDQEILDAVKRAGFTPGTVERVTTPFEDVKKPK